jgi:hypothetical protein
MREILAHGFKPYNIEIFDLSRLRYGVYEDADVCLGTAVTTKGAYRFAYWGERIEGKIYPHLRGLGWGDQADDKTEDSK